MFLRRKASFVTTSASIVTTSLQHRKPCVGRAAGFPEYTRIADRRAVSSPAVASHAQRRAT